MKYFHENISSLLGSNKSECDLERNIGYMNWKHLTYILFIRCVLREANGINGVHTAENRRLLQNVLCK